MSVDQVLNTTPVFTSSHTFSTEDITGTFGGLTQGDVGVGDTPVIDFSATPVVNKAGVELYPINSEFGYFVTDFEGAVERDFVENPEYDEGFAGDLQGEGGEHIGLVVSDESTETFKTPALLGTWLSGLGGNAVKASTEHYVVMQAVLSDQRFPGDPLAEYPLDDNLVMIGGDYDGMLVEDVIAIVGDANGDGVADIKDVLEPNESTVTENIAASSDYSVTLKDDGKLLFRWGNMVKKPIDVRIETQLDLPEEWTEVDPATGLLPLYRVTAAELVTSHTITNNPNDQIRPEDYENESAIGKLPSYTVLPDGKWVSTGDFYAGDGTFYPAGTVLKDPALAIAAQGTPLDVIGGLSSDLKEGFTNAYYTTMDREPFEPELTPDGTEYVTGPRWRLQPPKFGQDLPGVDIPLDPTQPPPPTQDQIKYEVGEDTQTVINLLDWENPISPLSISAGFHNNQGTVSANGVNMSDQFDVAFYIKGDKKGVTLYNTELVMDYEQVAINGVGDVISGTDVSDYLVGQGNNTFTGDSLPGAGGEDLFVLSYGVTDDWTEIQASTITDFEVGTDTIGLFDMDITEDNFLDLVEQTVVGGNLEIKLAGIKVATLNGVTQELGYGSFLFLDRQLDGNITGTAAANFLVGDAWDNMINGGLGNDTILGLASDDQLYGEVGDDSLMGGDGDDTMMGGIGADQMHGDDGNDTVSYADSAVRVGALLDGTVGWSGATGDQIFTTENLIGSAFHDVLVGSHGANLIQGGDGDDRMFGLEGDDTMVGGAGADEMYGHGGIDTVTYADAIGRVGARLDGLAGWGEALGDTSFLIENLIGTNWFDTLVGNHGANRIEGGGGDDRMFGLEGDDTMVGGEGADEMYGHGGIDTVTYASSATSVGARLDGIAGWNGALGDTIFLIENLIGSAFGDTLVGNGSANRIEGGSGDDRMFGLAGDDVLEGGAGSDEMYGHSGSDTFVFADGFGTDTIADFDALDGNEKIDLSGVSMITDFADLTDPTNPHMTQVGTDVVVDDFSGGTITLLNTTLGDLDATDFVF